MLPAVPVTSQDPSPCMEARTKPETSFFLLLTCPCFHPIQLGLLSWESKRGSSTPLLVPCVDDTHLLLAKHSSGSIPAAVNTPACSVAFEGTSVSRQFLPGTSFPLPHMLGRVAEPLVLLCSRGSERRVPKIEEGLQKQGALCVPAADGATVSWAEHAEKPLLAWLASILLGSEVFSHVHCRNVFPANPARQGNGECGTHRKGFLKNYHLVNILCMWDFPSRSPGLHWTKYCVLQGTCSKSREMSFSSGSVLIWAPSAEVEPGLSFLSCFSPNFVQEGPGFVCSSQ